jgi:transcriptional regulator with XRE-family HTH domain
MNFGEIGDLIRSSRRQAKLTQAELAKRLGMSRATISQLETGVITELGVRKLSQICDRLGLEVTIQRRHAPLTLHEAYAENKQERQAAFKVTDTTLAKLSNDADHG